MSKSSEIPYHPPKTPRYDMPCTCENLKAVFKDAADFSWRSVYVGGDPEWPAAVFFIDGLVSGGAISNYVIRPISQKTLTGNETAEKLMDWMENGGVYNASAIRRNTMDEVVSDLVRGFCVILFQDIAISFETKGSAKRSVSSPDVESVIKGAKDSFVETLRVNTAMVRSHLRAAELCFAEEIVGRESETAVSVAYIRDFTNPELVDEALRRICDIDIDGLINTANLEDYFVDEIHTAFPQIIYTERADKFCENLLEGRVGVLIDGLPLGYLLPGTFAKFMRAPEDKSDNHIVATCVLMLRYAALGLNLLLPGFYIAIVNFHQEMIPTKLFLSIIESRADVPFSSSFEVIMLLLAFELLLEAGLRLPKNIGQSVSIIGGLVVGSAAIEAKIISPAVVIVVAAAGICSYTIPNQDFSNAIRIWRMIIVLSSAVAGLFGMMTACIALVYHLAGIESFGVAYLTPFAANEGKSVGTRTVLRKPMGKMKYRERSLRPENRRNQR